MKDYYIGIGLGGTNIKSSIYTIHRLLLLEMICHHQENDC